MGKAFAFTADQASEAMRQMGGLSKAVGDLKKEGLNISEGWNKLDELFPVLIYRYLALSETNVIKSPATFDTPPREWRVGDRMLHSLDCPVMMPRWVWDRVVEGFGNA